jgi:hypothetical protein
VTRSEQRFQLARIMIVSGIVILAALFFVPIPEANTRLVDICIGIVLGGWGTMAVQFFFGTSEGSVAKSEQLDRIIKGDDP